MVAIDGFEALRQFVLQTRHAKGMTQREVARRGGVPEGTIGSLEAGKRAIPGQLTMEGLARGLGVPYEVLDRLVRGKDPTPVADLVTIWTEDDPEIRELLIQAAQLPPDRRDAFAAGLRALVAALKPKG